MSKGIQILCRMQVIKIMNSNTRLMSRIAKTVLAFFFISFVQLPKENGIKFDSLSNWAEVLDKAKQENKFIFVDCYATWCSPCKEMERNVFSLQRVGERFNEHFISIRLQMDTFGADDENVKKWYSTASALRQQYHIVNLPCYLFFSPNGNIVHMDIGEMSAAEFEDLAEIATDPARQYYTLLATFKEGACDYSRLPYLTKLATKFGEDSLAVDIATSYVRGYLNNLGENDFLTKENLGFIALFPAAVGPEDKVFKEIYNNPKLADSLIRKGFSTMISDLMIRKQFVDPLVDLAVKSKITPGWNRISDLVTQAYSSIWADRAVTQAKVNWYRNEQNWPMYSKYLVKRTSQYLAGEPEPGFSTFITLNNAAWSIFLHSKNGADLEAAVGWIDIAIPMENPPSGVMMDTKANLLYKLGKRREAIECEKKAVFISKSDAGMVATLKKMKMGQKTW